jgi:2-C-methyl-D-erythritol 4-phosphate cytidylyltransferase
VTASSPRTSNARSSAPGGRAFVVMVVAAGSGERLGHGMPKARVDLGGRTILERALESVQEWGGAARVVVTLPAGDAELAEVCRRHGAEAVEGGSTRAASVAAGLERIAALPERSELRGILVHDAARCLAPPAVFDAVAAALEAGERAVIPVLPVTDTVKAVDAQGYVASTPQRAGLRIVQTPQGFDLATLEAAHREAALLPEDVALGITDDAMLAETLGIPVATVPGSAESLKITVPLDLLLARTLLEGRAG